MLILIEIVTEHRKDIRAIIKKKLFQLKIINFIFIMFNIHKNIIKIK